MVISESSNQNPITKETIIPTVSGETLYQQFLLDSPFAVFTCDADGYIKLYNDAAVVLWGAEPQTGIDKWFSSWKLFRMDGSMLDCDECAMATALTGSITVVGEEIIIEQPGGIRRNVLQHSKTVINSAGAVAGSINMLLDLTSLKIDHEKLFEMEILQREIPKTISYGLALEKEVESRTKELEQANSELAVQNGEKELCASELAVANRELAFQHREKEKRASELITSNRALASQIEKTAQLIIANGELAFQNEEKRRLAVELMIAKAELAIHKEENNKTAMELIIANKELAFQNNENKLRAEELIIVMQELAVQKKITDQG